jgi:ABC-2 type transport system permease protein
VDGHQLGTLLWLRWRLTRNQWRRGGEINAVIMMVIAWIGVSLGVVGGIAGILGGWLGLAKSPPWAIMLIWDGLVAVFLFFWLLGIVAELQRSEMIDLGRLLHLPVSVREVFVLNYVASHLSLSLAIVAPTMVGLTFGLVLGRSVAMALLAPLVFAFFFAITAWTYCLRGWLASLMVNQRRRRTIVVGVTVAFVLLAQMPNFVINVWPGIARPHHSRGSSDATEPGAADRADEERQLGVLSRAHWFIPLLWLPLGARTLAEGQVAPAILGTAGLFALGALGLARAYRSTLRFYRGEIVNRTAPAPRARHPASAGGALLVERTLPMLSEETAAVALANFRSMTRAPEVKLALAMNVAIFLMIGVGILVRHHSELPDTARPFVASGAVVVTFLGLLQVLFNLFGFDRQGFRALVLLPTARHHILLGKNLSLAPFAAAVFGIILVLLTILVRLSLPVVLAAGLEFCGAFLVLSTLGNLSSILMPYRIAAGSLKPTRTRATTNLFIGLTQLLLATVLLPVFIPPGLGLLCDHFGWLPGTFVMLGSAAVLAAIGASLYWATLEPLGRLLQRREQRILQIVTQEVE